MEAKDNNVEIQKHWQKRTINKTQYLILKQTHLNNFFNFFLNF